MKEYTDWLTTEATRFLSGLEYERNHAILSNRSPSSPRYSYTDSPLKFNPRIEELGGHTESESKSSTKKAARPYPRETKQHPDSREVRRSKRIKTKTEERQKTIKKR